jgi:hypothetical protein
MREHKASNVERVLLQLVAAILCGTATLKLCGGMIPGAAGTGRLLETTDPIFPFLTGNQLMKITGGIEILVAFYLWRPPVGLPKFGLVVGLTSVFFLYRSTLKQITSSTPCKCFGLSNISLIPANEDDISVILLAVLFAIGTTGCAMCLIDKARPQRKNYATRPR